MPQGRTGVINYRCPQCLFRAVDYDLLYDREADQFYCRRCNWEGSERDILYFYDVFRKQYPAMSRRFTVEEIINKDEP